jgi:hypothetical protein
MRRKSLRVNTSYGLGTLKNFYVTELGYLMVKVYYPIKKSWINHRLNSLPKIFKDSEEVFLDLY